MRIAIQRLSRGCPKAVQRLSRTLKSSPQLLRALWSSPELPRTLWTAPVITMWLWLWLWPACGYHKQPANQEGD
eukprot:5765143-Alexandrium_andersonii.AAC.1